MHAQCNLICCICAIGYHCTLMSDIVPISPTWRSSLNIHMQLGVVSPFHLVSYRWEVLHHQDSLFSKTGAIPSMIPSAMSFKRPSLANKNHVGFGLVKYL